MPKSRRASQPLMANGTILYFGKQQIPSPGTRWHHTRRSDEHYLVESLYGHDGPARIIFGTRSGKEVTEKLKPPEPRVVPGNVPGAYMTIYGPAPTAAEISTPEHNVEMLKEPEWRRAFHWGVCDECMLSLPFCVCG